MARWSRWAERHLDIVYPGDGVEAYARCPFTANHKNGDKTPSLSINLNRGLYFCHGCKEKGNFQQLAAILKVSATPDAPTPADVLRTIHAIQRTEELGEEIKQYPESWLNQFTTSGQTIPYWSGKRGLSEDTVRDFRLGYEGRSRSATIPIRDFHGNVLGVIRRRLDPAARPRYVYPKGFHITEHLWGSWRANGSSRIAIVEGSVDALALWDIGVPSVALLGSRISAHQRTLLKQIGCNELVVMTDNDGPGREADKQVHANVKGLMVSSGTYDPTWRILDAKTKKLRAAKDPAELKPQWRLDMFNNASNLLIQ